MLNLILFGPPGSGKGTQSLKLIERYSLKHISTGDLLRSEMANNTDLGMQAKQYIDNGKLVPDEVVIGMINNAMNVHSGIKGLIFDGFPRTIQQAEALDMLLINRDTEIHKVILLEVEESELIKRLVKRGEQSGRSDDNAETIQKRIVEYKLKTEPVAAYYKTQNKVVLINGIGNIDDIYTNICNAIDK
jgi:Adenylate kinase (EC 2.7.4.3)